MNSAKKSNDEPEYWEEFYSKQTPQFSPENPSQFSVFCLNELDVFGIKTVVDLACRNGRDSLFFLQRNMKVYSIDQSKQAILKTESICKNFSKSSAQCIDLRRDFSNQITGNFTDRIALYARFFIHALTNSEIEEFLKNCSNFMKHEDILFLEYRNKEDEERQKETKPHYRNFVDPNFLRATGADLSLQIKYEVSGFGFAKHGNDDACVTRQIFEKL